ncbi:MAG: agmatinase [Theionarchaea archaeon]|nr:agmatinase [Theionarchaea archaeon]
MMFFSQSGPFALDSPGNPDWILFGIPFDSTSSFNTGSRFGPDSIREASYHLETYDYRTHIDLTEVRIRDVGNLHVTHGDPSANNEIISRALKEITLPFIALGGDHSISYPLVTHCNPDVCICLDAHLDLRDEYLGEPLSHACASMRITQVCPIHIYGFRECSQEEYRYARENSIRIYAASEMKSIEYPVDQRVYLSVDLDVLDPSVVPAVSNPVPGGLSFEDVVSTIESILQVNTLVSMDMCELCSRYADSSAVTAAMLLYKILALWRKCNEGKN